MTSPAFMKLTEGLGAQLPRIKGYGKLPSSTMSYIVEACPHESRAFLLRSLGIEK